MIFDIIKLKWIALYKWLGWEWKGYKFMLCTEKKMYNSKYQNNGNDSFTSIIYCIPRKSCGKKNFTNIRLSEPWSMRNESNAGNF